MIMLYLDWNVISQMKNGSHQELKEIVLDTNRFLIPYSTSHIGDILSSFSETAEQQKLIDSDLEFITQLTKNLCLFNRKNEIVLDDYSPKELFQQRIDEKDLFKDISLNELGNIFESDESTKGLGDLLSSLLKSIPIDEQFRQAFENPESAKQMETLFPGLKENPTMEGFFKSFSEMNIGLNEDEKYKDLRGVVQSGLGINRDSMFDSQSPYKAIQAKYKQLGQDKYQQASDDKYAPKWFNEISNEYLHLDMHGYQEDKVNTQKGRKETFKNTTEDAFHAAFASTCNFYVLNDNRAYKKTKQVYEKLGVNTLTLKPDEFVEHYKKYLDLKEPGDNLRLAFNILQNGEYVEEQLDGAILRTYYFYFFIFDFFTKLRVLIPENGEESILFLSRDRPTNGNTYVTEITRLVKSISTILGADVQNLGEVKEEELKEDNWIGRSWKLDGITFRLVNPNGHFQLYIDQERAA